MGASSLIVLIIAAVAFSGIAILIAKLVLKTTDSKQKGEPYECPDFFDIRCGTGISLSLGSSGQKCRLGGIN
jgi:hypothetical protein